ncbi:MAG: V-type ATP synthase subunit I [Chlamydiae bacterium]|nr:V-type ATP synthase subunit I [Chlamydiota bacterium]
MIIDIDKYLFVGAKEELNDFFAQAQKKGVLEFIPSANCKPVERPLSVQNLISAIKILRKCGVLPQVLPSGGSGFAKEIAAFVLHASQEIEKFQEQVRFLRGEIARVEVFGEFSLSDLHYIEKKSHRKIQFFCRRMDLAERSNTPEEMIYLNTENELDYFMAINTEAKTYPNMIEVRIEKPVQELEKELSTARKEITHYEKEMGKYAKYISFLQAALAEDLNHHNLQVAKTEVDFSEENRLFYIEAWTPKNKKQELTALLTHLAVYAEPIAIEETDKIPTYMENKNFNRLGEDLVHIYDTPAHTDKDPSGWVIWAFALFFAMIVADGGYGFLYLGLALFLKWKFPSLKGLKKRLLKLMFLLSTTCIIWGFAVTSFFGLEISPKSFLGEISLVNYLAEKKAEYHISGKDVVHEHWMGKKPELSSVNSAKEFLHAEIEGNFKILGEFSQNILLELSLLVGAVHIALSLMRNVRRHLAGIGWIIFIIGGYMYFPYMLNATSMIHFLGIVSKDTAHVVGLQCIYAGTGTAVVLAIFQHGWSGIKEILNVVSIFGDILSYLRIYALSLASFIMASTFNNLGEVLGFFIGFVVVLLGHSVNIFLGIMGGVIHGLRLNFLEWYHYSFQGGGKLFNPLRRFTVE